MNNYKEGKRENERNHRGREEGIPQRVTLGPTDRPYMETKRRFSMVK